MVENPATNHSNTNPSENTTPDVHRPHASEQMAIMAMLMELQKDMGTIQADIRNLNDTVKDHGQKVSKLRNFVTIATTAVTIIGGIILWVLTTVGGELVRALAENVTK